MTNESPIALVGMMGAGKSTVAEILGSRLQAPAVDLDALIEAEAGQPIAEIFAREGETGFRRREATRLEALLRNPPAVLACGGGAVLDPGARSRLRERCRVVWLEVSPEEAYRRVGATGATRPVLAGGVPGLASLLSARRPLYAEVAELRVSTDGRSADQVADAVLSGLGIPARRVGS
jgi:shikimate kinase